jgi:hypothetical protein
MKKYTEEIKKGHIHRYDLSNSKKLLEEVIDRIKTVRDEFSKNNDIDLQELEEAWNLIDKYYGNVVRGEIFKNKKGKYIPNTSATFPIKGDS